MCAWCDGKRKDAVWMSCRFSLFLCVRLFLFLRLCRVMTQTQHTRVHICVYIYINCDTPAAFGAGGGGGGAALGAGGGGGAVYTTIHTKPTQLSSAKHLNKLWFVAGILVCARRTSTLGSRERKASYTSSLGSLSYRLVCYGHSCVCAHEYAL